MARKRLSYVRIDLPIQLSDKIYNQAYSLIPNSKYYKLIEDHHITLLFGLLSNKYLPVKQLLKDIKAFEITLGKISLFENYLEDILKIEVHSQQLFEINKMLTTLPYEDEFGYNPHITIARLASGEGKNYVDKFDLPGISFNAEAITFCPDFGPKVSWLMNS